jgi:formylglycine-generating enzyme required for sulfatase activity
VKPEPVIIEPEKPQIVIPDVVKTQCQPFEFDVITVNERGEEIKKERGQAYQYVEDLGGGVTLEMAYIPGGTFQMGSPETEEGRDESESPHHEVMVMPFYMGKYPVTQEQWEVMMENNPSNFKGVKRPVETVSWDDAVEFCKRLSESTDKTYRLPSEAEWEYACRARTTTPFYFGVTITPELANYDNKYNGTTEVGKFPPNAFGLYNMHGNVWEWCADPWHYKYEGAPSDSRVWKGGESHRVIRGGGWVNVAPFVRCAFRDYTALDSRDTDIGFRLARTI